VGYILVRTVAVAVSPTDWKHIQFQNTPGGLVGCDYAGIVEEVACEGASKRFERGDRVACFVHGANAVAADVGAFAKFILAKANPQMRIPDNISFEAATLGMGVTSVGQGLYQALELPIPKPLATPPPASSSTSAPLVLIHGGSTASGALGIQYARISGYTVLTTCSPHNFDAVKALGAAAAFDYGD
jgi:NADPH:quinone reductase-like Zn-dependent oxidoreductase